MSSFENTVQTLRKGIEEAVAVGDNKRVIALSIAYKNLMEGKKLHQESTFLAEKTKASEDARYIPYD
jgi:hypothetical protein